MLPPFKNARGSVISRGGAIAGHRYKVGKVIGGKVYIHVDYIDELPNPEQARIAMSQIHGMKIRCLSFDPREEVYMFSEAPDFDTASEPYPGESIRVEMDGDDVEKLGPAKIINQIWHHKWMWVDDRYRGFNVKESYEWSKKWAAKISNPSGSRRVWEQQLADAGLALKDGLGIMREIRLKYHDEAQLAEAEIVDMEKILEHESIYEQQEDAEDYSNRTIVCFTFEDSYVPGRDQQLRTAEQFKKFFEGNDRVFCTTNVNGFNVFIATERTDLYPLGYVVMDTKEFMQENPDSLYDIWVEILDELKS